MTALESVGAAAEIVRAASSSDYRILVGIAGAPGAGKSSLAAELAETIGTAAIVLPVDGFHYPQSKLVELGRRDRMGAPDTFDVGSLLETLVAIRRGFGNSGVLLAAPGFDRDIEEPVPDAIHVTPEISTVIVEGNYLLFDSGGWERIFPLLDLTFFVDLDRQVRLERLVARHVRFGKTEDDARAWALGPDEANATLIEGTASRAGYRISLR
ncbi:MAG TPA: nucleoside/nucleotide kinase family protein [Galbitalea sp.]|jgi:pantothenate kinase